MQAGQRMCRQRYRRASGTTLALLAALLAPAAAQATNGYFAHGYSAAQRALGGAGTALAEDALVVSINPAGVAWLEGQLDVNLSYFRPVREYVAGERGDDAGPGVFMVEPMRLRSEKERFLIPALGYARRINPRSAWGVAVYGNGGLNTTYRGGSARLAENIPAFATRCAGTFGGGPPLPGETDPQDLCGNGQSTAMVDLIQLFVVPSYAYRFGERVAVGVAPILAAQQFSAEGLNAFARFSNEPERVSDNGSTLSYGAGARVGVQVAPTSRFTVGASWQSRVRMSRFDDYAGLFADRGRFDVPSTWNLGASVQVTPRQRLVFDYQRINFSEVRAVGNPLDPNRFVNECALPRLLGDGSASPACLGAADGPGFGWQDVRVRKYGYQLALRSLIVRLGYSRSGQPIPTDEVLFNILAPAVPEVHYTAGLSFQYTETLSFDLGVMYARNNPVTGKNPLSHVDASLFDLLGGALLPGLGTTDSAFGPDPQDQDITLDMRQFELTLGLTYRFR